GRFKSCLVDSERYLLIVHRYIELNPIRAAMATSPEHYRWSSAAANSSSMEAKSSERFRTTLSFFAIALLQKGPTRPGRMIPRRPARRPRPGPYFISWPPVTLMAWPVM
ncbi:MAG TPA: hypothetical protein PKN80_05575, partial [bacterium]|nr:hypothetical protein [bacterium]